MSMLKRENLENDNYVKESSEKEKLKKVTSGKISDNASSGKEPFEK